MRRRVAVATAVAAIVAACTSSGGTPSTTTPPPPSSTTSTTVEAGPTPAGEPGQVTFVTRDGLTLEGTIFGTGPDWVILAHMRPADMNSWFPFAEVLAAEGHQALAFNFRGYGSSQGSGFAVDVDVKAAIDFAGSAGAESVSLIGASMGGTGAIAAAAERDVAAVVTLSAPAEFSGVDAVAVMPAVEGALLFVAAEGDQPYASDIGRFAAAAPGPVNTLFLEGSAHGTDLFADHGDELRDQILAHLSSAAG